MMNGFPFPSTFKVITSGQSAPLPYNLSAVFRRIIQFSMVGFKFSAMLESSFRDGTVSLSVGVPL